MIYFGHWSSDVCSSDLNDFLADKAGIDDGDDGELRRQFDARHERCNRRDDHGKGHRREIALRFFVALCEKSNRSEERSVGKEYRYGGMEDNVRKQIECN